MLPSRSYSSYSTYNTMRIFKTENMQMRLCCKSCDVGYKKIVTSTVNPKNSAKMDYSQKIRSFGCVPSF